MKGRGRWKSERGRGKEGVRSREGCHRSRNDRRRGRRKKKGIADEIKYSSKRGN